MKSPTTRLLTIWAEIEDNMAAKHAHSEGFVDFKYGRFIKALTGRSIKSVYYKVVKVKSQVPHI